LLLISFYDLFIRLSNHASGRSGFSEHTSKQLNARQTNIRQSNCQDEGQRERKCQRDFNHD
jgi:hypothetical protein